MKTRKEILIKEGEKILLARVLLEFNLPMIKYPETGVWCYMINSSEKGITILDAGPKYKGLTPWRRKSSGLTNNTQRIAEALEEYFPDKTIEEIICSHYHFDHTENGPDLQKYIASKFNNTPPMRLHKNEYGNKKMFKFLKSDLNRIFKDAGEEDWLLGEPVEEGYKIGNSGFMVKHTPGHTTGNISLVNNEHKVALTGWWVEGIKSPFIHLFQSFIIDEDSKNLPESVKKINKPDYKYYFYHPQVTKY